MRRGTRMNSADGSIPFCPTKGTITPGEKYDSWGVLCNGCSGDGLVRGRELASIARAGRRGPNGLLNVQTHDEDFPRVGLMVEYYPPGYGNRRDQFRGQGFGGPLGYGQGPSRRRGYDDAADYGQGPPRGSGYEDSQAYGQDPSLGRNNEATQGYRQDLRRRRNKADFPPFGVIGPQRNQSQGRGGGGSRGEGSRRGSRSPGGEEEGYDCHWRY
jgi:hypothetical protein